ncbi:MAG TPA: hypothetical protein VM529_08910, partial [Gemmata sp.]|nr:hypothetical protein [Gemmata sp.]
MRPFALAALVSLAAGAWTSAADDKDKELAALLDRIEQAMEGKQYKDVIDLTAKAAKLDDKNPAIPFAAGTAHLALRQNDEAVKAFTRAIE